MRNFETPLKGLPVLVTGHTGFCGGWLVAWLNEVGAQVHGIALAPDTSPSLFAAANIASLAEHHIQDIRERDGVIDKIKQIDPVVVFHLAAQPLVRRSYDQPLQTFDTNVMGTANILEACRHTKHTKAVVCITTDKVYQNHESPRPYREDDPFGGKDPYSASKACAEIVAACFRQSLNGMGNGLALATARGGNIVGGGDWSEDRLVPDFVRAITTGTKLVIRNPNATRPWQHVLGLCEGYLRLASGLLADAERFQGGWNFGPSFQQALPVHALLDLFGKVWQSPDVELREDKVKQEAQMLALDSTKAFRELNWNPPWSLQYSVEKTAQWYRDYNADPTTARDLINRQIHEYRQNLADQDDTGTQQQ